MATATGTYATLADVKLHLGLGTATTTDDALLQDICDQVNGWIESPNGAGRVLAPYGGTYTFDGYDATGDGMFVRMGIVTLTGLEIAAQTGGTFATIPATDYFLVPGTATRQPGWPSFRVLMTDAPVGSNPYPYFPSGYQNVRMAGTFGWPAIPDEITAIAIRTAIRAWTSRQGGQSDQIGTDEYGRPIVSNSVAPRDKDTLRGFRFKLAP